MKQTEGGEKPREAETYVMLTNEENSTILPEVNWTKGSHPSGDGTTNGWVRSLLKLIPTSTPMNSGLHLSSSFVLLRVGRHARISKGTGTRQRYMDLD